MTLTCFSGFREANHCKLTMVTSGGKGFDGACYWWVQCNEHLETGWKQCVCFCEMYIMPRCFYARRYDFRWSFNTHSLFRLGRHQVSDLYTKTPIKRPAVFWNITKLHVTLHHNKPTIITAGQPCIAQTLGSAHAPWSSDLDSCSCRGAVSRRCV